MRASHWSSLWVLILALSTSDALVSAAQTKPLMTTVDLDINEEVTVDVGGERPVVVRLNAVREGPIEQLANKYLPVFDRTLSTFLQDLDERGLLETTSVVVWGEFGRTPRINAKGGRDHWAETQSIVLAGGGLQGGRVLGRTDKYGGRPIERPIHVQEVFATLYKTLGIDVNSAKTDDMQGRPRYLVDENRQPISELFG